MNTAVSCACIVIAPPNTVKNCLAGFMNNVLLECYNIQVYSILGVWSLFKVCSNNTLDTWLTIHIHRKELMGIYFWQACALQEREIHLQILKSLGTLLKNWFSTFSDTLYFCLKSRLSSKYSFTFPVTAFLIKGRLFVFSPCCITDTENWRLQLVSWTWTVFVQSEKCTPCAVYRYLTLTWKWIATVTAPEPTDTLTLTSLAGNIAKETFHIYISVSIILKCKR